MSKEDQEKKIEFQESHPSFKHLILVKKESLVIAVINYDDFPDTKHFDGTCIDDNDAIEFVK